MTDGAAPAAVRSRRALVGACLGNAAEWYDFAIYGAFSTIIARLFFPGGGGAALAATFAIFATSFIIRPVGAMMVGRRSDRVGRRPALSRMIVMMTVATAAIGLLPTWSAAGVLAPVSLLLLRLMQGFSVGGEIPSSIAFTIESAPERERGWYGGWHLAGIAAGLAAGCGVAALLAAILSEEALFAWGWRVAFLIAAPLGLVARYIRRRLEETPMFESVVAPATPRLVRDVLRGRVAHVGGGFMVVAALGLAFNTWFVFLPSHLIAAGVVPFGPALGCAVIGLSALVVTAPMMGRRSDRIGRRPVLIAAAVGIAAFAAPGFLLAGQPLLGLLVSDVVMGVLIGTMPVTAFVAELFPTSVRATGVALTYGIATAIFGGTAPLIGTLLAVNNALWAMPVYLTAMALLVLVAAVTAEETALDGLR